MNIMNNGLNAFPPTLKMIPCIQFPPGPDPAILAQPEPVHPPPQE